MVEQTEVDKLLSKTDNEIGSLKFYDKSGVLIKTLNEEDIKAYSQELLEYLLNSARKYKDFGMMSKVLQQLIDIKKVYWPATQVNKNLNVSLFDDQLEKWSKARQELKDLDKKAVVEYEIVNQGKIEEII